MAVRNDCIRIDEATEMPATVNLHLSAWYPTETPQVGDVVENCKLIAELGHGGSGRVFLAQQPALADRFIVLKVTALTHEEHLNMARLQHTHIMPLYWASDHPYNGLRVLAMPYLAKTTLSGLLDRLRAAPVETWNGERVFVELQKDQEGLPARVTPQEQAAQLLAQSSWIDFVLRIGHVLAEALAFAHRRNLLHLDVKPSNILITPDGQPILLDMDVGHQPIAAGTESIPWFGGTPAYMSPEQREAMKALSLQKPIPMRVDERSDVYSLGMVLYHALGGKADENVPADPMRLPSLNPQVSKEVAQIIARCVADAPGQRYADCSALAADLDRQLHDLPLRGVPDRVSERWRKWRRRRPLGLPFAVLFVSFCAALSFLGISYQQINLERRAKAEASLLDGQELQRRGQYEAAVRRFHAGQQIAAQTIGADFLKDQLARRLHNAQRLQYAQELNETVRLMRFGALEPRTPRRPSHLLEAASRKVWTRRAHLTDRSAGPLETPLEQTIDNQLQELVLLWSDLQMRLAPVTERDAVQEEVARVIGEAEDQFGTSFAIQLAKDRHGIASTDKPLPPRAAWEYCAVGRAALADGKLARAHADFIKALELEPLNPVANYYAGVVDLREKRYADALQKLSLCLGADPVPECFVFRGEAYAALAQHELALRDFQQAIDRQADFAPAYEQRGQLCQKLGRHEESKKDLERARQLNQ